MYKYLIYEKEKEVAKITFNREDKLNAVNPDVMRELETAFEKAEKDNEVKIVVLTGKGKAFVAGADISAMKDFTPLQALEMAKLGQRILYKIENSEKIVIAMINGYALGGGCEIAMACDLRIASENAKLGQPEINLGIIPGWAGTQRLARLCGKGKAKELIFTGDLISSKEALRIGLVNKVVEHEKLEEEVNKLIKKLKSKGFYSLKAAKKVINYGEGVSFQTAQELEAEVFATCFTTHDQKEGMKAFIEKRTPEFVGE